MNGNSGATWHEKYKVLIVDAQPLVRDGLRQLINAQSDLECCGEAGTQAAALDMIASQKPDLVTIDICLHNGDGLELLKKLRAQYPLLLTLIITQYDESIFAERALKAGARGYVMKDHDADEVLAAIRRLLRENPMAGMVSLTFEREPDFFADTINPFELKQTIVARDGGQLVCIGSCTTRSRFINGKEIQVGYLGGLRLAASHAGQTEILRAGYGFFHQLQLKSPAEYYFTSIASDNLRTRRLLERGLAGLPAYQFMGELVTLMIPAKPSCQKLTVHGIAQTELAGWADRLNRFNQRFQLAPAWSAAELEKLSDLGLSPKNIVRCGETSAVWWDQSNFKQTVIRGYAPSVTRFRQALNVWSRVVGSIRLPVIGQRLRNAYVSHVVTGTNEKEFVGLLNQLRSAAGNAGVELLTLAFAADDVRLRWVKHHFRSREYRSRIYRVSWPDCGHAADVRQDIVLAPEVALL